MNSNKSNQYQTSILLRGLILGTATALAGCVATTPTIGGGSATAVTGAAGGANSEGSNASLEKCTETLGTLRIEEDQTAPWFNYYRTNYRVNSTVPILRLMIQQSNCFIIVERGRSMNSISDEMNRGRGPEARAGSNVQQGQQTVADYLLSPEIMMNAKGTQGIAGALGGLLRVNPIIGALSGGASMNEAGVVLLLTDIRSTQQISAAEGYSKNWNFNLGGALFGALGAGAAGGFMNTPEGKLITSAFADGYNKMVVALRQYKAQTVRGGAGTGGRLGVQGGQTPASQELTAPSSGRQQTQSAPADTKKK